MGEYVPSAASFIEVPTIRKLHDRYGVVFEEATAVPALPEPAMPTATGLGPPLRRQRRENNPLMTEASRPRDTEAPVRWDGPRFGGRQGQWSARSVEQQWAEVSSGDAAPAFEFEEWKLRGFTEIERDVWMDAGLRPGQAKWAAELRDGGLIPADLQAMLNGWKVIERLSQGEGATAVARLLRASRDSQAG